MVLHLSKMIDAEEEVDSQSTTSSVVTQSSCWGHWNDPKMAAMVLLELFAGTGSVSKVAKIIDAHITSIDINAETAGYKPDIVDDILNINPVNLQVPDIITASPPCQTYSIMTAKHRTKEDMSPKTPEAVLGLKLLTKTVEIVKYFHKLNPKVKYYIENPVGRMQYEEILKELPDMKMYVVSYCKFGFLYRKNTHIFSNDKHLAKLLPPRCSAANPCEAMLANGGKHPVGIQAHPGMAAVGADVKGAKAKLWERYRQPGGLWAQIFRFPKQVVLQTVGDGDEAESEAETMLLPDDVLDPELEPEPTPEPEPEPDFDPMRFVTPSPPCQTYSRSPPDAVEALDERPLRVEQLKSLTGTSSASDTSDTPSWF